MTVAFEEIEDKLLTIPQVKEALSKTEPITEVEIPGGKGDKWRLDIAFNAGIRDLAGEAVVPAALLVGDSEYPVTVAALLEATSAVGLTKAYVSKSPSHLIEPHLNYWYKVQEKPMKAMILDGVVHAITRQSVTPFSNLELTDRVVAGIQERLGNFPVYADWKMRNGLDATAIRFVIPSQRRHPREGDTWCTGVELRNSLIGVWRSPTSLRGYLFRYTCANGAISTHASSGSWSRRTSGDPEDVYAWAQQQVDDVLGGLEHEFEALEELASLPVEGSVSQAMESVFEAYGVPGKARERILQLMVDSDDLTMYGIMAAITQAANDQDCPEDLREALLLIGGDIPRSATDRCSECQRMSPSV